MVVTGGAQGIGLGVVGAYLKSGARVWAIDSDAEALDELPSGAKGILCDVGDSLAVEKACGEILRSGHVDVLVNNAGVSGDWKSLLNTRVEDWDRVLNINLRAYWLMAKYLVPSMREGSAIVNIASTRALMSEPNTELYSASKGGIVALTHALAISLAERRIRVNCISPGWIDVTQSQKQADRRKPSLRKKDHEQHPVGRVGIPADIAQACLYLSSEGAGFITGANLVVDGGMTRKMIYVE